MRLRRGKRTTALAVAVLGGLLSAGAPAAVAAPSASGSPALGAPARTDGAAPPAVWPRPQSIEAAGASVALSADATLVAGPDADPYAVEALRRILRDAGVRTVHGAPPGRGPVIRLGGDGARDALRALRAPRAAICRRVATGSRSAGSRAGTPSRWTASVRTASSTACRRCVS